MKFTEQKIDVPTHDHDVRLVFANGQELTIQLRPSNADVNYEGSLDIILPQNQVITCWQGDDMEDAPEAFPGKNRPHERRVKQIVTELPTKRG